MIWKTLGKFFVKEYYKIQCDNTAVITERRTWITCSKTRVTFAVTELL